MKASAIRVEVQDVAIIERAVPQEAIATVTITFQLRGALNALKEEGVTKGKKAEKLMQMLRKALQDVDLGT